MNIVSHKQHYSRQELVVKSCKGPLIVSFVDALLANSTAAEFNDSIVKELQACIVSQLTNALWVRDQHQGKCNVIRY